MPMGRMIGLSLALMAISVGAIAKTADKSAAGQHAKAPPTKPEKAAGGLGKTHAVARRLRQSSVRVAARRSEPYAGPMRVVGPAEIGDAVWYSFAGGRTANGDRMDGVTLTAAHRSLPLDSYAKVTNLDNGRAVVVRINDRGPKSRRFVIDLSKPAAEQIQMMHSGVAAVSVEPVRLEATYGSTARTMASYPNAEPAAAATQ
jgi:rare lipoprotein A